MLIKEKKMENVIECHSSNGFFHYVDNSLQLLLNKIWEKYIHGQRPKIYIIIIILNPVPYLQLVKFGGSQGGYFWMDLRLENANDIPQMVTSYDNKKKLSQ